MARRYNENGWMTSCFIDSVDWDTYCDADATHHVTLHANYSASIHRGLAGRADIGKFGYCKTHAQQVAERINAIKC